VNRSPADIRTRATERGFTLVELVIVMVIVSILVSIVVVATRSARVSSRNSAMKADAAAIDGAISSFNRIYPAVGGTDPLMARGSGVRWDRQGGDPSVGLADETGEWLLSSWPQNPYAAGGVRVYRAVASPCTKAGAAAGDILVCRSDPARPGSYEVVGWGRAGNGSVREVYRVLH
jgi:prepilin-type N-terminal cleavage/methylation domain-containing protein